jgi:hypothetical protein
MRKTSPSTPFSPTSSARPSRLQPQQKPLKRFSTPRPRTTTSATSTPPYSPSTTYQHPSPLPASPSASRTPTL